VTSKTLLVGWFSSNAEANISTSFPSTAAWSWLSVRELESKKLTGILLFIVFQNVAQFNQRIMMAALSSTMTKELIIHKQA
jgi:hypothetical protein